MDFEAQALLEELLHQGKIKPKMPWKVIYPLFKEDERYLTMLGNPGSTPLELYWDVVDQLDQVFDVKVEKLEDMLKEKEVKFTASTTLDDVKAALGDQELDGMSKEDLAIVFDYVSHIKDVILNVS